MKFVIASQSCKVAICGTLIISEVNCIARNKRFLLLRYFILVLHDSFHVRAFIRTLTRDIQIFFVVVVTNYLISWLGSFRATLH